MSRFPFLTALVLFTALPPAFAEQPAPDVEVREDLPSYELKRRSSFEKPEQITRAPFWPIGWTKRASANAQTATVAPAPQIKLEEKNFKVTSILIGSGTTPSLAVINGRAYSEGEFLRMPKGTANPPRVRVQRISDGSVILGYQDQTLVASLQRPELSTPKTEELLLDPDR